VMSSTLVVVLALGVGLTSAAPFEVNTLHGGARSQFSSADSGTHGSTATKQRPISKVINMLKDMNTQLEEEQKADEEAYEKFSCWCETNDKAKVKAIADAEQKIKTLTATIEELGAKSSQMTTEIATLEATISKGKSSLAEASEVRAKELAEFNKEDKDAIVSIKGLHSAVETLSKHNAGAALTQEAMLQVHALLSRHASEAKLRHLGIQGKQRRTIMSLIQQPVAASSYSSASGEIFGVLTSMKESFESNMASARKEEEQAAAEFATLKKAKTEELAAANDQLDSKTAELAAASEGRANAKTDLKDTEAQLETDQKFHADLTTKCAAMDKEWEARQKMRQDETAAVTQALEILADGEARDLATKTTGFVQMRSVRSMGGKRAKASKLLMDTAERLHRPKLALLAAAMKSDVFDKMVVKIKALIDDLHEQKQEEVKHKDYCVEELHKSSLATDAKYHEKTNLETKQADLDAQIKRLTDEMAAAREEIAAMQIQMKKASEARKAESDEFTTVIAEQRAMQAVLRKALKKLREFFDRKSAALLEDAQEPAGFTPYRKGGGGMVIATLAHIVADSEHVQTQCYSDNGQGQLAYEEFMRDTNKAVILLKRQIVDQTEEMAQADADLTRVKADLHQNMEDLEAQDALNQQVHKDCDFTMKNFEQRQESLDDEVDALYEAISMMGGDEKKAL